MSHLKSFCESGLQNIPLRSDYPLVCVWPDTTPIKSLITLSDSVSHTRLPHLPLRAALYTVTIHLFPALSPNSVVSLVLGTWSLSDWVTYLPSHWLSRMCKVGCLATLLLTMHLAGQAGYTKAMKMTLLCRVCNVHCTLCTVRAVYRRCFAVCSTYCLVCRAHSAVVHFSPVACAVEALHCWHRPRGHTSHNFL